MIGPMSIESLDKKIEELRTVIENGFDEVGRPIDKDTQPQIDEHAHRIKKIGHHLSL